MRINHTSSQRPTNPTPQLALDADNILDIVIKSDNVVIFLRDGTRIETRLTHELKKLYWDIKLRNRKRAFGL